MQPHSTFIDNTARKRTTFDFHADTSAGLVSGRADDCQTKSPIADVGDDTNIPDAIFPEKNSFLRTLVAGSTSRYLRHGFLDKFFIEHIRGRCAPTTG